jgi:hypothetical protein
LLLPPPLAALCVARQTSFFTTQNERPASTWFTKSSVWTKGRHCSGVCGGVPWAIRPVATMRRLSPSDG